VFVHDKLAELNHQRQTMLTLCRSVVHSNARVAEPEDGNDRYSAIGTLLPSFIGF